MKTMQDWERQHKALVKAAGNFHAAAYHHKASCKDGCPKRRSTARNRLITRRRQLLHAAVAYMANIE